MNALFFCWHHIFCLVKPMKTNKQNENFFSAKYFNKTFQNQSQGISEIITQCCWGCFGVGGVGSVTHWHFQIFGFFSSTSIIPEARRQSRKSYVVPHVLKSLASLPFLHILQLLFASRIISRIFQVYLIGGIGQSVSTTSPRELKNWETNF